MRRFALAALIVPALVASAVAGYWFGFREGWTFSLMADAAPRGVLAMLQVQSIANGKPEVVQSLLESDIDRGLIWSHELFKSPLRDYVDSIWGVNVYPRNEGFVTRLANYRKEHPSQMNTKIVQWDKEAAEAETEEKRSFFESVAQGGRDEAAILNEMIERYSSK